MGMFWARQISTLPVVATVFKISRISASVKRARPMSFSSAQGVRELLITFSQRNESRQATGSRPVSSICLICAEDTLSGTVDSFNQSRMSPGPGSIAKPDSLLPSSKVSVTSPR